MDTSSTAENDAMVESSEDRFIYDVEVPTLENMASNRVALAIWYGYISQSEWALLKMNQSALEYFTTTIIWLEKIKEKMLTETEKLSKILKTPRSVEQMIKESLKSVICECWAWIVYLRRIFPKKLISYNINCIDPNWWVWMANGRLDFQKTSKAMLASGKLNEMQKFVISCSHCFEDEIDAASVELSVDKSVEFVDYMYEYKPDLLLQYWTRRRIQKLSNVSTEGSRLAWLHVTARYFHCEHYFAFEYFWHWLHETDQESILILWISRCENERAWSTIERLISSMCWVQQRSLLFKKPVDITSKFMIYSQSSKSALWPWKLIKDTIDENDFFNLVFGIAFGVKAIEKKARLLIDLWDTARDPIKKFVALRLTNEILRWVNRSCSAYVEFCVKVLRQVPKDTLKKVILKDANRLTTSFNVELSDKILDLCTSSPDDRSDFKKSLLRSSLVEDMFLSSLWNNGNVDNLYGTWEWYFSDDSEGTKAFRKVLLEKAHSNDYFTRPTASFFMNMDKWIHFCQFIDKTFPNDESSALKEKQSWILLLVNNLDCIKFLFFYYLNETIQIIETVFANEDLKNLKLSFYDSLLMIEKSHLLWTTGRFVIWCKSDSV